MKHLRKENRTRAWKGGKSRIKQNQSPAGKEGESRQTKQRPITNKTQPAAAAVQDVSFPSLYILPYYPPLQGVAV